MAAAYARYAIDTPIVPLRSPMSRKNVLLVYAHPESRSLNGAIKDLTISTLKAAGHDVVVSDLYAMHWKAVADAGDFTDEAAGDRFYYARSSARGYKAGTQTKDIEIEQKKLVAADGVILQFPLWWFSMPAILKGWIDRVFAYGLAYGIGYEGGRYGTRYGEGSFVGKRALICITAGGQASHFSDRGVNGAIDRDQRIRPITQLVAQKDIRGHQARVVHLERRRRNFFACFI